MSSANPYQASCGSNQNAFTQCIGAVLNIPATNMAAPTVETFCYPQQQTSGIVAWYTCLCSASTQITTCYTSLCSTDPSFATAKSVETEYCGAQLNPNPTGSPSAQPVVTGTAGMTGSSTATAPNFPVTTTTKSAAIGKWVWPLLAFGILALNF